MSSTRPLLQLLAPGLLALGITIVAIDCQRQNPQKTSVSSIVSSGIPPIPDSLRQEVSRYQNWRSATLVDWGPDGRSMLVLRRADETSQLFAVNTATEVPVQMTNLNETVLSAFVCPDPRQKTVLFTQDSGGNENFQIYSLALDSRKITRLTRDSCQNDGIVWSNRGDRFAYSSNRRNGKDFDIYIHHSGNDSLILSKGGMWSACDWSPDDKQLLVSCYVSRTASRLFVLDIKTRSLQSLTDSSETVSEELGAWAAGGRGIFFTSDRNTDFRCLRYFDRNTRHERLLTASSPWDVREFSLSRDRDLMAFATNEHGFSRLYLMDAASFAYRPIPGLPRGIISNLRFHPSGAFLGMTVTTPNQPDDVYALNLCDFSLIRWTKSESIGPGAQPLVEPVIFHYPSFDSINGKPRLIPCIAYKPAGKKSPFPVLITIHGGPESQFWPSFKPDLRFQINELGIAILAPNVRGSGGYGKTWLTLDNGYQREDAVRDIGALLGWIAHQPDLDTTRVAVMGGSYGGFMALASLVKYNGRLAAGIDFYGISNFVTFLEQTAPYRRDARRVEYGDERDPAMRKFLLEISPLTHAGRIAKPILIIQGANDARVPITESRQIADTIRKNHGDVWFLVANDEGHGYRKKSNREYQDAVTALFLGRFLVRQGREIE
jgi:dipeptidyl aminopeptidase/acylaminoacyl peptidase